MTQLMALLLRELDELNYAIEMREGWLANLYERRAGLERRIAEHETDLPNENYADHSARGAI